MLNRCTWSLSAVRSLWPSTCRITDTSGVSAETFVSRMMVSSWRRYDRVAEKSMVLSPRSSTAWKVSSSAFLMVSGAWKWYRCGLTRAGSTKRSMTTRLGCETQRPALKKTRRRASRAKMSRFSRFCEKQSVPSCESWVASSSASRSIGVPMRSMYEMTSHILAVSTAGFANAVRIAIFHEKGAEIAGIALTGSAAADADNGTADAAETLLLLSCCIDGMRDRVRDCGVGVGSERIDGLGAETAAVGTAATGAAAIGIAVSIGAAKTGATAENGRTGDTATAAGAKTGAASSAANTGSGTSGTTGFLLWVSRMSILRPNSSLMSSRLTITVSRTATGATAATGAAATGAATAAISPGLRSLRVPCGTEAMADAPDACGAEAVAAVAAATGADEPALPNFSSTLSLILSSMPERYFQKSADERLKISVSAPVAAVRAWTSRSTRYAASAGSTLFGAPMTAKPFAAAIEPISSMHSTREREFLERRPSTRALKSLLAG
eukprot:comp22346_c0_seq1/m.53837 comp22346_c0_seq1/g.53837  ORF comp22346_c0_seq1/g.53837 comp22346_c0_seq1/m.53837 type:complete len:496 (-) comp22346_c0_seq1:488-1975(-)